ncbi:MAG: hypothetical protein ACXV5L_00550 [Thermoanaerobaculia bacterium]
MKADVFALLCCLVASACAREVPFQGKHVPIPGPAPAEKKLAIASSVLAKLPAEKVREAVHSRFPNLTPKQLQNIVVGSTTMTMVDENNRKEVHLYVDFYQDPPAANVAEVNDYAAWLLENEMKRQMSAAHLPLS